MAGLKNAQDDLPVQEFVSKNMHDISSHVHHQTLSCNHSTVKSHKLRLPVFHDIVTDHYYTSKSKQAWLVDVEIHLVKSNR
jgi:hypothetical protein